jgi:hypothetical protein
MKISNDRKHARAPRGDLNEVVVGEIGTVAFEFLTAAPFAIHVAMQ